MIIARSPLRITLGGGGTDLPSYYEEREGFLISAAIDKYVYITLHETFEEGYFLKYSKFERCMTIDEIQHPIIREALKLLDWKKPCLELCSMADIPAGTGLGSSSSFTTALLRALHTMQGNIVSTRTLAEEACDIEMNRLGEPIGKQDQYIASYGGITCMNFHKDGYVWVDPLRISDETLYNLEDNLILFFTGFSRSAGNILKEFGLNPDSSHIINGHVPVETKKGQTPIRAGGKVLMIDGGFSKAYHAKTGIAGYTLAIDSHGMWLVEHEQFESKEEAVRRETDIVSDTLTVENFPRRMYVEDTDNGKRLKEEIADLKELLAAYRSGELEKL